MTVLIAEFMMLHQILSHHNDVHKCGIVLFIVITCLIIFFFRYDIQTHSHDLFTFEYFIVFLKNIVRKYKALYDISKGGSKI